jgi:hypothetical protein
VFCIWFIIICLMSAIYGSDDDVPVTQLVLMAALRNMNLIPMKKEEDVCMIYYLGNSGDLR